jgi:hypothetical protein
VILKIMQPYVILYCIRFPTPVSYFYLNSSLKSLLSFIGLDPAVYKGHSFRIEAATAAAARGVLQSVIQSMGK